MINIREYLRAATDLGLSLRVAAILLGLHLAAVLFEGIGVAMLLPIFQFIQEGGDLASLAERGRHWQLLVAVHKRVGIDINLITLLTTAFVFILARFAPHMLAIKISSGDLTYHRLIRAAAATGKPVLLSTGMASLGEVAAAAGLVPAAQRVVLHCVSVYPLPDEQANLRAIPVLGEALPGAVVGYSDHTIGPEASLAAVALGARVIEKHFTLDSGQSPGDHVLSLDPAGMAALVHQIRRVEAMLGEAVKRPAPGEAEMRRMMRRGLYAARDLTGGAVLSAEDILCLRPATALDPAAAERLVGRRLTRDVRALEPIDDKALG